MSLGFVAACLALAAFGFSFWFGRVRQRWAIFFGSLTVTLLLAGVLTGAAWMWSYRDRTVDCQVTQKITTPGGERQVDTSCGTFTVNQSLLRADHSADDTWGKLQVNQRQRLLVHGTGIWGTDHPCNVLDVITPDHTGSAAPRG